MVGYLSAFSDEVISTLLGELVVHPLHQRKGIATQLISCLQTRYPEAPIYVKALGDAKHFFRSQGFQVPQVEISVLFKQALKR